MTGGRKTSDISARLGVKRSKPTSTNSTAKTPVTPPKTATAPAKPKNEETQRRKNYFNDMLSQRSGKDKDNRRSSSSKRSPGEDGKVKQNSSPEGRDGEQGVENRISELERELKLALEEQSALKQELARVQEQGAGQTSSPERNNQHPQGPRPTTPPFTASSMPIDIDSEEQSSPRQTSSHSFHRHSNSLVAENYDLRAQVAQLQDQIQNQELAFQSCMRTEADWYELTLRLHATEKESEERLQQLLSLKSSISSLTRMDSQITDSELSEGLTQLANRIREWVVTNYRKAKLSFKELPPDVARALEAISPMYREIENRLALYQAIISNALMQIFREQILIGLTEAGPLASVGEIANHLQNASPAYREWRRCTIRNIERREGDAVRHAREKFIHNLAGDITHQLYAVTSTHPTQHARSTLEGIINTAADLQHTLLLQKADYRMHFFRNQMSHEIDFDDFRMESINDLDEGLDDDGDVIVDRRFAFCVSPCLEKLGDEYGENTGVRNVLLRARVCCSNE